MDTAKWQCGPVALPVIPTFPIRWPLSTAYPVATATEDMCR